MYRKWCGKPCAYCETSCEADESIPCSPDCELLGEDGEITDYLKCLESGCDVIQIKELYISPKTARYWQKLVDMSKANADKGNADLKRPLIIWSVEFDDGHVAKLKVCSKNNYAFLDVALYEQRNCGYLIEKYVPDCPKSIIGDHTFFPYEGEGNYVLRVSLNPNLKSSMKG